MAILKIVCMGHPILKSRAAEVADLTSPEIHSLINDMIETLADIGGAGLAAPRSMSCLVVIFPGSRPESGWRTATRSRRDPADGPIQSW